MSPAVALTAAELQVARFAAAGLSNHAIAQQRGSSVRTVANQMASILRKLRLGSRAGLDAILIGPPVYIDPLRLSVREREVVARAARGAPQKVIAIELGLALSTVSTTLRCVRKRFGLPSLAELARAYRPHAELETSASSDNRPTKRSAGNIVSIRSTIEHPK